MKYLLDTCTISEITKETPDGSVISWFEDRDETRLYLSVITTGEIEKGIYALKKSKKRDRLESWYFDDVIPGFRGRILEIGQRTMSTWAKINADLKKSGILRPSFDSLLEATALEYDMILVTRNIKNFIGSSAAVFNPWE